MKSLKAILLGILAIGAVSVRAEYLLWTMDWADTDAAADSASIIVFYASGNELSPSVALEQADHPAAGTAAATTIYRDFETPNESVEVTSIISSPYNDPDAGYKFALRVYDENGDALKTYAAASYSDLSDSIWGGNMNPGVSTSWSPTKYAVPEPASGTLFIVGALMLFRRKRA